MVAMNVLHVLTTGETGGIETLCRDYAQFSKHNNTFLVFYGKNGAVTRQMYQNGADVIELDLPRGLCPETVKKVNRICKEKHIDVIVVQHESPITHLVSFAVKLENPGIRIVAYAHCFAKNMARFHEKNGLFFRKIVLQFCLGRSAKVVAISEAVKHSLTEYFHTAPGKIQVVYNGVDLSRFERKMYSADRQPVQCIYVGRLIEEKGVQVILHNLANVPASVDYRLLIVGEGPYREELENLARNLKIDQKVQFLGVRKDVPMLLKEADVFLHMPVWEEGFGIAVVEAMASGIIPVCAKAGGIPEIISDGEDGFLVEKYSHTEAAAAICRIAEMHAEERNAFGLRARAKARQFSIELFAEKLDKVISEAS